MADNQKNTKQAPWHWEWVKSISILAIVAMGCYKLFETNLNITVDFPTLLSLLLGFFSVWLASLFYFKATDSSNAFYDNTHKFTAATSQLLAKIEAGFGERLKSIEGHNQEVRDYMVKDKRQIVERMEVNSEEVKKSLGEKGRISEEREGLIEQFLKDKGLSTKEINSFKETLKSKAVEIDKLENKIRQHEYEIDSLNKQLSNDPLSLFSTEEIELKSVDQRRYDLMMNRHDINRFMDIPKNMALLAIKQGLRSYGFNNIEMFIDRAKAAKLPIETLGILLSLELIPKNHAEFDNYIHKFHSYLQPLKDQIDFENSHIENS